jgi:hypothetical protein
MISGGDVLHMLIPTGGWYVTGNDYEGIEFLECEPITKKQFEDGFIQYAAWKSEQDTVKATQKAALLDRLGITEDEAKLLLG